MKKISIFLMAVAATAICMLSMISCDENDNTNKNSIGAYVLYDVSADEQNSNNLDARLEYAVTRLQSIIVNAGYMEVNISREDTTRIRIKVFEKIELLTLINLTGYPVDFQLRINGATVADSANVSNAYASTYEDEYVVQLQLDEKGTSDLSVAMQANIGGGMDIVVNYRTIYNSTITTAITNGRPMILGDHSYETASTLAQRILSGTIGIKLTLIEGGTLTAG